MQIERPTQRLGAIVTGLDLRSMTPEEWELLYRTWLDAGVLVVRDQELSIEDFLGVGARFGRLKPHRARRTRHPDFPALTQMGLNTRKSDGKVDTAIYARGQGWHTDSPWDTEVCKATQLYGLEIPSVGGDTLFADMVAAYEALPPAMKQRLEGMTAEFAYGGRNRQGIELLEPEDQAKPPVPWPVLRVHPETGRTSLYINPVHFIRFTGLEQAESDALAEELFALMVQPGAEYRHHWQRHDFIIWDNRCLIHAATGGYPLDQKRIHWRATIMQ